MSVWTVEIECVCKAMFFGRTEIIQEQRPKIGEQVSSMKCPVCKKSVKIVKIFEGA